jgi:Zn-dependent peptidase ImmA (M78 family)
VTYFEPPEKPRVLIARQLFEDSRRVHRLRYTLAHEYVHVRIHAPLYARAGSAKREDHKCRGDEIEPAERRVDWMEWQANYAAGALLMPVTRVELAVEACLGKGGNFPLDAGSPEGNDLKQRVSEAFMVSQEAAAVRLSQLRYIANQSH